MCGRVMDKWSIIRSLHHGDAGHSTADQLCFTGYPTGPKPDENISPSCGSIVAEQMARSRPDLPAYVMIPRMVPGTGAAYLGVANKPFETQAGPRLSRSVSRAELFLGGRLELRPARFSPRVARWFRSA